LRKSGKAQNESHQRSPQSKLAEFNSLHVHPPKSSIPARQAFPAISPPTEGILGFDLTLQSGNNDWHDT
ncbi:MAG: hypothetical protein WAK33_24145, partial [Silvibacterium sp.]